MQGNTNRICPYCGNKLTYETYGIGQCICYCNNDKCIVKPCTDATSPSRVYEEILAITGDKE